MKFLATLLFLLGAPSWAGQWLSIEVDHANLIYSEGERASFSVRLINKPSNPDFQIRASVEMVGTETAVDFDLISGIGAYASAPLAAGIPVFRFVARIRGPNGWERVLEQTDFPLKVINLD